MQDFEKASETLSQAGADRVAVGTESNIDGALWAIGHRRSMGLSRLKPDPVDPKLLEVMLEAANWAPSNDDTEPWRFIVYSGAGRDKLADAFEAAYHADRNGAEINADALAGHRNRAYASPVWIAIGVCPKYDESGALLTSVEEEVMAVACATQNLHLAAASFGLGGMLHSKGLSVHPTVAKEIGWDGETRLLGFFFFGWPNIDWPLGERGSIKDKTTWNL